MGVLTKFSRYSSFALKKDINWIQITLRCLTIVVNRFFWDNNKLRLKAIIHYKFRGVIAWHSLIM